MSAVGQKKDLLSYTFFSLLLAVIRLLRSDECEIVFECDERAVFSYYR